MNLQFERDKIYQVNISGYWKILGSSTAISSCFTTIYLVIPEEHKIVVIIAVTTLVASFTALSILYAYRNMKHSVESQKLAIQNYTDGQLIDRTICYIKRWNEHQELISAKRVAAELSQLVHKKEPETRNIFLIQHLANNQNQTEDITIILNFLEEMAICIEAEIVKEDLLMTFFKGIVRDYYKVYFCYIQERRNNKQNPKLYEHLTNLWENWSKS